MYDPYAALRDYTRPRSSGVVQNKHAVRAKPTTQPDLDKMREMSHPHEKQGSKNSDSE